MAFAFAKLQTLWDLLIKIQTSKGSGPESRCSLLDLLYDLRYMKSVRIFINGCRSLKPIEAKKLLLDIAYLGRIKSAHMAFIQCINDFPHFSRLNILPREAIHAPDKSRQPRGNMLSLESTLQLFKLSSTDTIIKQYIRKTLTFSKANSEFTKLQGCQLPAHAEVQATVYMLQSGIPLNTFFGYIGCSKLSCYLCSIFIQSCGNFATRGCHQRLHPKWTIPTIKSIEPQQNTILHKAVRDIRNSVTRAFLVPVGKPKDLRATSTADVTSLRSRNDDRERRESIRGASAFDLSARRAREHRALVEALKGYVDQIS